MKINGNTIQESNVPPTEEGYYIFTGKFTNVPEIIHVVENPAEFRYGVHWGAYMAVANHRLRNVESYSGTFVKIEL